MERAELCPDCQLANTGVCDYLKNVQQITEALGLSPQQKQEFLKNETSTAIERGCSKAIEASQESPQKALP